MFLHLLNPSVYAGDVGHENYGPGLLTALLPVLEEHKGEERLATPHVYMQHEPFQFDQQEKDGLLVQPWANPAEVRLWVEFPQRLIEFVAATGPQPGKII